jgi:hypothetical protein
MLRVKLFVSSMFDAMESFREGIDLINEDQFVV